MRSSVQSSEMTRTAKNSARLLNDTSSDQETEMQGLEQQPSTSQV